MKTQTVTGAIRDYIRKGYPCSSKELQEASKPFVRKSPVWGYSYLGRVVSDAIQPLVESGEVIRIARGLYKAGPNLK